MEKADLYCPRCRRHQRVKVTKRYELTGVETAFTGRCPDCGAWLFKMVRLRRTA